MYMYFPPSVKSRPSEIPAPPRYANSINSALFFPENRIPYSFRIPYSPIFWPNTALRAVSLCHYILLSINGSLCILFPLVCQRARDSDGSSNSSLIIQGFPL